jgi:hypothetical protein
MAEAREKSLIETRAALDEIKAQKRVTFASVAPIDSNASNKEVAARPMSPASSYTSGSAYLDPEVAATVSKALDWARSRRNMPKN